ncbi:MAG: UPF0182 family protein [Acidimicrobiales bacterium]
MRAASDMPNRPRRVRVPSGRGRVVLIAGIVGVIVLIASLRGIAGFYTDYLWYDSVDQRGVWAGVLGAKGILALIFTGAFFVLMWVNLLIADRIAPTFRPAGPEEELVERYRAFVGTRTNLVRGGVSLLFALIAGAGVSTQWESWLLFTNAQEFGIDDALFQRDVGFYVFQLPFLRFIADWLLSGLMIVFVVTLVAHYVNGGIRLQSPLQRVTPQVKAHLSVLLALLALVKAGQYFVQQYDLTVSTRGFVDGAGYTDVNVQLPAIRLLLLISLFAFVLFIVNIFRRGWVLPILAVGLWGLVAIIGGGIVPALVQRFRVQPDQSRLETQFIERNIEATREAMALVPDDHLEIESFPAEVQPTDADLAANVDVLRNVRLWDPSPDILGDTYGQLENTRQYFEIREIDTDRYSIDERTVQVNLSVRELNTPGLSRAQVPATWENQHLAYTHGYGIVASPANAKEPDGEPLFIAAGIPVRAAPDLGLEEPRVYIGEDLGSYVIVNSQRPEIDHEAQEGAGGEPASYDGEDGIELRSFLRRSAFALRYGDVNLLVSGAIDADARLLMRRDVKERVEALAPFLDFDDDPYAAVVDGRIVWIVDAYTVTDRFPYAQQVDRRGIGGTDLDQTFNYARNSIKVAVDAYDGTATFYVIDEEDPLARAWSEAFPDLFADGPPPEELAAHFRYPEDLFTAQTNMWAVYHQSDPVALFEERDLWSPAQAPTDGGEVEPAAPGATQDVTTDASAARFEPYYLLTRLPGDDEESFVMLRPFEPADRPDLIAFMVARSDPGNYGELQSFRIGGGADAESGDDEGEAGGTETRSLPASPVAVVRAIESNVPVSEQLSLLRRGGSDVRFANLVMVPLERSLLFVRPVYVEAQEGGLPLLRRVIVYLNGDVAMGDTFREALVGLPQFTNVPDTFELPPGTELPPEGEQPPTGEEPPTSEEPPTGDVESQAAQLLTQAQELFDEADAALREGDLATYAARIEEAQTLVEQARALLTGGPPEGTPEETTTTAASP